MNWKINFSPFLPISMKTFVLPVCAGLLIAYSGANQATDAPLPSRLPNANWKRQLVHTGPHPYSVVWCGQERSLLIVESVLDSEGRPTSLSVAQLVDVNIGAVEKIPLRPYYRTTVCTPDGRYAVIARNIDAEKNPNDDDLYFYDRQSKAVIKVLSRQHLLPYVTAWNLSIGLLTKETAPKHLLLPGGVSIPIVHIPQKLTDQKDTLCGVSSTGLKPVIFCYTGVGGRDITYDINTGTSRSIHYGPIKPDHKQEGAGISARGTSLYILARKVDTDPGIPGRIVYRQDQVGVEFQLPKLIFQNVGDYKEMPDGRYAYAYSEMSERKGLYLATNLGKPIARLTNDDVSGFAISPDGKAISYIALQSQPQNATSDDALKIHAQSPRHVYVITAP